MNKILLTGGSGLLGTELQKYIEVVAPSHKEMDILRPETYIKDDFDIVIHAAAYTNLLKAEKEDKLLCYMTNVLATKWLAEFYKDSKFVYISSEYAYEPVNWYSWTKLWGEEVISHPNRLILRTLFKPRPFPHTKACVDQWTFGGYVDEITPRIVDTINKFNKEMTRQPWLVGMGRGKITTYELAKQTRPDVEPCLVEDIKEINLPRNKDI